MRSTKAQFLSVFLFLAIAVFVLTNGFSARIFAESEERDVFQSIEPIGSALSEIMKNYVEEPDLDKVVEGALEGMMRSLDKHSSYIPPKVFEELSEDTKGEFEGIGVSIKLDDEGYLMVYQPVDDSPAFHAGILAGDHIVEIDGVSAQGMSLEDAASRIKGPRGTVVRLKLVRTFEDNSAESEVLDIDVKRDKIPLQSISEVRMLPGGIGYLRLGDFKQNTADDMQRAIEKLSADGMKGFVLDLRWNPGGLLNSSQEVCELFLPRRSLVTFTRGREINGQPAESMNLYTRKAPVLPLEFPIILLTSGSTASSAEIVTGALQYHQRAIVVGEKSFGKGSVQTIIPLEVPAGAALRLTTALYYTPADVTIHERGILPDVEVAMTKNDQIKLLTQLRESYQNDPTKKNLQNHGAVSGDPMTDESIDDAPLAKAVEMLNETTVFADLLKKYHKDTRETQVATIGEAAEAAPADVALEAAPN